MGEQGLLSRLQSYCPSHLVGDDAALLTVSPEQLLVVTTDVLVDGVHFSDRTTSPEHVGWRAAAANLSDLAAMGATPLGITVGLSVPRDLSVDWVEHLYQGMVACLQQFDAVIVGGDLTRSSVITVAIAAFGQVLSEQAIRRSTAKPGDAILVTGIHGASRAGLELLLNPQAKTPLTDFQRSAMMRSHQQPQPRLEVPPLLWQFQSPALRVTGMDSSDGLADAVIQICRASGVGAELDRQSIPLPDGLEQWVGEARAIEWALYGGEDFELVLCLPEEVAQAAVKLIKGGAIVGHVTDAPQVVLRDATGRLPDEILDLSQGFQHFSP
jgi:thiamine-monophosphate kinase